MGTSLIHPIPPFFRPDSEILILGSFPSVASREVGFFYGHPRNRFWKVTADLFAVDAPETVTEKKAFLEKHRIALWDVIQACEITGSSDASIKNVVPNDLSVILNNAAIKSIYCNGTKSYELFCRYTKNVIGREATALPSTSPANAAFSLKRLEEAWAVIRKGE